MKALITGGYGFIGSHVCDKFYREGYEIYIIDNLSTGSKSNVQHKHRLYEMNVEDLQVEDVFKNNKFDVVVHLAAQIDPEFSNRHPSSDAKSNVLGTVNLLNFSSKYKSKRFIFISSEEVYGLSGEGSIQENYEINPVTILGLDKMIGESYCTQWRTLHNLDTTILRLGSVYGPRQRTDGQGIPVGKWIHNLLKHAEVKISGNEQRKMDILYVEDVATVIYNAANIKVNDIMNVSSNQLITYEQLFRTIAAEVDLAKIKYNFGKSEVFNGRQLDNHLSRQLLDWQPMTSLDKGMTKTFEWFKDHLKDFESDLKIAKKGIKSEQGSKWKSPLIQILEAVIAFLLIFSYKFNFSQQHLTEPFDLGLLFIIGFSLVYGSKQGVVAILLSALATIGAHVFSGKELLMLFYQSEFFVKLAFYVFVGFVIGYAKDNKEQKIESGENQVKVLEEKLEFATFLYHDMREIRDELQNQIVNSEDSFGKIFSVVQTLDTLSPEEVFAKAINVIERLMQTDAVAIYRFDEQSRYARLMAKSEGLAHQLSKSINIEDYPEIYYTQKKQELYVSRQVGDGKPIMVMPVFDKSQISGGIVIYRSDFERLTLSYQNYFKVISNLVSASLMKAYAYDAAIEMDRYIEGTGVLKIERFADLLESKRMLFENNKVIFTLLHLPGVENQLVNISEQVNSVLRETDAMGLHRNGQVYVLLSNTENKEAEYVIKRLEKMEIVAELIKETD